MSEITASIDKTAPGEKSIIGRSRTYRPDILPLILFIHGYTGDASFVQNGVNKTDWDLLVKSGFPCISTDMGGIATFGNDASQTAIANAIAYARTELRPKAGGVHIHCGSMGTLGALRYAKNNHSDVLSIAVETPAFDMQYLHDVAPGVSQDGESASVTLPNLVADMNASTGGASLDATYYAEHSPIVYASPSTLPMPIKAWMSNNDILANGPVNSPVMADLIGPTFTYHILGPEPGLGHSIPDLDSQEVLDFFHRNS